MSRIPLHRMPELSSADYENNADHLVELESLVRQIDKDMPEERIDAKSVARFQMGLLQFMENALGPNSMPPRQFPKLPFHLIDDHHPSGALYSIMMKCLQLKEARNLKHLEWQNPQQRMLLVSILGTVRSTLIKNGYPISPTVLFDESLPAVTAAELTSMVESMKGKVVKDRNAVGLTHIVYPFPNGEDPDDGEEYMRTQRRRADKALVHRWYHPDSHNTWLDASVAPETIENDLEHVLPGPAKDSKRYNEWMNIVDYETPEGDQEHEKYKEELRLKGLTPAQLLARKRKASRQVTGTGKMNAEQGEYKEDLRLAGVISRFLKDVYMQNKSVRIQTALLEVDPNFKEFVSDGVVRRHMLVPTKRVREGTAISENLSNGQLPKLIDGSDLAAAMLRVRPQAPPTADASRRSEATAAGSANADSEAPLKPQHPTAAPSPHPESSGAAAATHAGVGAGPKVQVPRYAHWFRFDRVHDIERNGNIEFFNGSSSSKTETSYTEIRNFMVAKYREAPQRKLPLLECRKLLIGDAGAIQRVWRFLESWGLINYQLPLQKAVDDALDVLVVDESGETGTPIRVLGPPQSSLPAPSERNLLHQPLATVPAAVNAVLGGSERPIPRPAGTHGAASLSDDSRRVLLEAVGQRTDMYCSAMPWVKCEGTFYHCIKHPDIRLCVRAFSEGCFPSGSSAKDFVKVEAKPHASASDDGWTSQETLLLLEGLTSYGEKWGRIAELIGSKSRLDCLIKFASLPIKEHFADALAAKALLENSATADLAGSQCNQHPDMLFASEKNPLAALLAFLGEVIGTRTAAAAAAAALEELQRSRSCVLNGEADPMAPAAAATEPSGAEGAATGQAHADSGDVDAMDIDAVGAEAASEGARGGAQLRAVVTNGAAGGDLEGKDDPGRWKEAIPAEAAASVFRAALLGAATKAKQLAEVEEQRTQELTLTALNLMHAKTRRKLKYLDDIDVSMEAAIARIKADQARILKERDRIRADVEQLASGGGRRSQERDRLKRDEELLAKEAADVDVLRREREAAMAALPDYAQIPPSPSNQAPGATTNVPKELSQRSAPLQLRPTDSNPGTTSDPAAQLHVLQTNRNPGPLSGPAAAPTTHEAGVHGSSSAALAAVPANATTSEAPGGTSGAISSVSGATQTSSMVHARPAAGPVARAETQVSGSVVALGSAPAAATAAPASGASPMQSSGFCTSGPAAQVMPFQKPDP